MIFSANLALAGTHTKADRLLRKQIKKLKEMTLTTSARRSRSETIPTASVWKTFPVLEDSQTRKNGDYAKHTDKKRPARDPTHNNQRATSDFNEDGVRIAETKV